MIAAMYRLFEWEEGGLEVSFWGAVIIVVLLTALCVWAERPK